MKIYLIINSLIFGGAERQVIIDSILLSKAGYEVAIIYKDDGPLIESVKNKDVRFIHLTEKTFLGITRRLFNILQRDKPDYLFAHMFWAQKISSLPAIFTKTNLIFFEHGLGLWKRRYHIFITHLISFWAKKIITVSYAKKQIKIEREGFSNEKILVIPNSFYPVNKTNLKILPKEDVFKIAYAGRFNSVKQLHLLVDIAAIILKRTRKFCFILLGDGPIKEELKAIISNKRVEEHFMLLGYVVNPQEYLINCDAFVLPSRSEDLSMALIEAASAGLPCVAFDVGGNKEIIRNNEMGFIIEPFNIQVFADKLIWLIENDSIAKKMGQRARRYANEEYCVQKRLENLNKIIE